MHKVFVNIYFLYLQYVLIPKYHHQGDDRMLKLQACIFATSRSTEL